MHEVLERLAQPSARFPRALVVAEIRRALDAARAEILRGTRRRMHRHRSARRTAPWRRWNGLRCGASSTPPAWCCTPTWDARRWAALAPCRRLFSNLEYDLAAGRRGKRDVHTGALLERLLGAPGIAVNNNAAAVFLALHELAAGGEVIVSRGELIEIGDGFRIPEIMARSGAVLREVGTTNRTRIDDYRDAINDRTRLLLRVHPSNFRITGFTARPDLRELVALGRERGIPVYEDLGSGCVVDLRAFGIDEPLVADSLRGRRRSGLLQRRQAAGRSAGRHSRRQRRELVARLRRNPLFRALRLDKLIYQALETTLRHLLLERWDAVPALRHDPPDRGRRSARAPKRCWRACRACAPKSCRANR